MATSDISYISDRDLQDVLPAVAEYDLKRRLYNWTTTTLDGNTYYVQWNSGLVTQLFIDGKSQQSGNQTIGTTAATAINEDPFAVGDTTLTVDSGAALTDSTYIKIDDEILGITAISTNNVAVTRGELGTTEAAHADDTSIYKHFQPAEDGDNLYDADNDFTILKYGSSPNDSIVEAGDDWDTIKARFRKQACRIFESKIDSRMTREIIKDREGNYPAIVIRACSLGAVILLLKAHDPNSELIAPFQEEYDEIIAGLIGGTIVLPTDLTKDNSQGIIREVSVASTSTLRPVELYGSYTGAGYDLIKLQVTATGILGTATYSVWVKDSDKLKQTQIVTDKKITGDYDVVVGTLYIRFSGQTETSFATDNDEYEIEVWGKGIDVNIPTGISTVAMTRR